MKRRLAVTTLIFSGLFSGCTQVSVQSDTDWHQHQAEVARYQQWQLRGKLGFKSQQQGGSANLSWSQDQQKYQLSFSGPLGVGSAVIQGNHQIANLQQGDRRYVDTPESLALTLTGLPIPVDALSWWVRGLPAPTKPAASHLVTDVNGTATSFEQAGWQLSFSGYDDKNNLSLPRKISGQFGDQSFKLVISHWSFPE